MKNTWHGSGSAPFTFQQIHIEMARNATDDFNPFHDKNRWQNIKDNPFGGAIVLGFQLETLIEYHIRLHREANNEFQLLKEHDLHYSNYEFSFVNAVKCGQEVTVDIKTSQLKEGDNTTLSNRVFVKADGKIALLGYKRESRLPTILPEIDFSSMGSLRQAADRSLLPGTSYFLTRKYMTNSNAKNFLSGSLVEQADYFDELERRLRYPEIFTSALLSGALLEKNLQSGHDFELDPMVYTSHKISVDRRLLAKLQGDDAVNLLTLRIGPLSDEHLYECYGVVNEDDILFRALMSLIPLQAIRT
ncbi:MAG: hypothetical protein GY784_03110 [Gammaproteobacteria bacterium]|nr:hypothetical protein [Gammaproteobacteria bacterium]